MSQSNERIQYALEKHLPRIGFDVVECVEIPQGERLDRLRAIEDILGTAGSDETHFLVRIRAQNLDENIHHEETPSPPTPEMSKSLYLTDGKINVKYLEHNAEVLMACEEYGLARNIFQTILAAGERAGPSLFGIGQTFEMEGRPDVALKKYEESITYLPSIEVFHRMVRLLIQQKKWEYAAETIERALNIKDLQPKARFDLHKAAGNCWSRIEKLKQAEHHYRKALSVEPSADEVRSNLGSVLLKSGKPDEARRAFEDAIAANSGNAKAHFGIALCFIAEGRAADAFEALSLSLEKDSGNTVALYHLLRLAFEQKRYGSAERLVQNYCAAHPVTPDLLYGLAALQFHQGKISESRETCDRILAMKAGHESTLDLLKRIEPYHG